jgi:hypothetical protein
MNFIIICSITHSKYIQFWKNTIRIDFLEDVHIVFTNKKTIYKGKLRITSKRNKNKPSYYYFMIKKHYFQ